jgi:lipopolysaccharide/colanic/teichoic acid biosynthesis glycosyltransferase
MLPLGCTCESCGWVRHRLIDSMPAMIGLEAGPVRGATHERSRVAHHVLCPELFREVLARERSRAIRLDKPCALRWIAVDRTWLDNGLSSELVHGTDSVWPSVIDALTGAVGETAFLGWLEREAVLGAIAPVSRGPDQETLLRRELARRLGPVTAARFAIRSHVYLPTVAAHLGNGPADPSRKAASASDRTPTVRDGIKRCLDVAGSLTLLLLLSPVFVLIALLMKLTSPGPILFRQTRIGQLAKPFTMLKFRTMRVDADPRLHHEFVTKFINSSAQLHPVGRKAVFKLTNDPRVTPIGRILRKASLDELPQLWNVLRGDMSLVGPRPPLDYEVEHYRPWHWRRVLEAKPGITGLWQVTGRSQTTFDEMVRLDLRYVRTRSLWTDIKILLATPRAVLSGKGAE